MIEIDMTDPQELKMCYLISDTLRVTSAALVGNLTPLIDIEKKAYATASMFKCSESRSNETKSCKFPCFRTQMKAIQYRWKTEALI